MSLQTIFASQNIQAGDELHIALDVSGGMDHVKTAGRFVPELFRAASALGVSRLIVYQFDHTLVSVTFLDPQYFSLPHLKLELTGGGTRIEPALDAAAKLSAKKLFVYSDGYFFVDDRQKYAFAICTLLTEGHNTPLPANDENLNSIGLVITV